LLIKPTLVNTYQEKLYSPEMGREIPENNGVIQMSMILAVNTPKYQKKIYF
jgi:hypothetical protein